MNRSVMAGLVAGSLLALVPVAQADPGHGLRCGFVAVSDPTSEDLLEVGVVDGGPLSIVDDTDGTAYTGSLTCTLQVGANSTHAGTDAFTVTGPTTTGVVVVPETPASYEATVDENVYLCSQLNIEGQATLYFADPDDPLGDGTWSTDPNASCGLAVDASPPDGGGFPFDVVDPAVCPVLALAFPGGDVPEAGWDCPPYGDLPPPPAPGGHITIHRFPADGARLWVPPAGWSCRDVHTGLPVGFHSPLQTPDPGVSCLPDNGQKQCNRLRAGGYHADAGLGSIRVTSACSTFSAAATTTIPFGWGAGFSTGVTGSGSAPWTCQVEEALDPVEPDYWVFCDVNL